MAGALFALSSAGPFLLSKFREMSGSYNAPLLLLAGLSLFASVLFTWLGFLQPLP